MSRTAPPSIRLDCCPLYDRSVLRGIEKGRGHEKGHRHRFSTNERTVLASRNSRQTTHIHCLHHQARMPPSWQSITLVFPTSEPLDEPTITPPSRTHSTQIVYTATRAHAIATTQPFLFSPSHTHARTTKPYHHTTPGRDAAKRERGEEKIRAKARGAHASQQGHAQGPTGRRKAQHGPLHARQIARGHGDDGRGGGLGGGCSHEAQLATTVIPPAVCLF